MSGEVPQAPESEVQSTVEGKPEVDINNEEAVEQIAEQADFSPEAKGLWVKLTGKAKEYAAKLYKNVGKEGGFLEKVALKADIWHSGALAGSMDKQLGKEKSRMNDLVKDTEAQQRGVAKVNKNIETLENVAKQIGKEFSQDAMAVQASERAKHEHKMQVNESAIKDSTDRAKLISESRSEYEGQREQAVAKLTEGFQEKAASNGQEISENNEQISEIAEDISEIRTDLSKGEKSLQLATQALEGFVKTGHKESDKQTIGELKRFKKELEEEVGYHKDLLAEAQQEKKEIEDRNSKLTKENSSLEAKVHNIENKYLKKKKVEENTKPDETNKDTQTVAAGSGSAFPERVGPTGVVSRENKEVAMQGTLADNMKIFIAEHNNGNPKAKLSEKKLEVPSYWSGVNMTVEQTVDAIHEHLVGKLGTKSPSSRDIEKILILKKAA